MRGLATGFLPSRSSSATGISAAGSVLGPRNGRPTSSSILIVEDEILTRMATAEHLRDCGYRVLEASDAQEARILLRAAEPIELVLSDVNMPGMDGITFARWIAKEFPDVRIMLTSGDRRNAEAARVAGTFLEKPYDFDALSRLIKKLL